MALRRPTKNPQNRSLLPVPFHSVHVGGITPINQAEHSIIIKDKFRSASRTLKDTDVDAFQDTSGGLTEQRVVLQDRFQVDLILEDLIVRFERLEVLYAWFLYTSTHV